MCGSLYRTPLDDFYWKPWHLVWYIRRFFIELIFLRNTCEQLLFGFFKIRACISTVTASNMQKKEFSMTRIFLYNDRIWHVLRSEKLVDNKTKRRISKRKLQENKARQIFRKTWIFTPCYAHVMPVSGGKEFLFFVKFGVLCFFVTPVLGFSFLLYCRRLIKCKLIVDSSRTLSLYGKNLVRENPHIDISHAVTTMNWHSQRKLITMDSNAQKNEEKKCERNNRLLVVLTSSQLLDRCEMVFLIYIEPETYSATSPFNKRLKYVIFLTFEISSF